MHHTQRGRQVSMIRRLTRQWWWAALGLLLLLAIDGYGIDYVTGADVQRSLSGQSDLKPHEVRSAISIDYHGDVWRTYFNRAGGATRSVKLGNINQPGGYRGPLPPGYNPPRQPTRPPVPQPRPVVAPRLVSTIKFVTYWGRQVRRIRNGRAYLDWDRHPNGTIKTVQMVGYRYNYANGNSRVTGVQAHDANMRRQGYQMVTYKVSTL